MKMEPDRQLSAHKHKNKKPKLDLSMIDTDLSVLKRFVELLDSDDNEDIIAQALALENLPNILSYLDFNSFRKPTELAVIFKALFVLIMSSTRNTQPTYSKIARTLAEGLLEDSRLSTCLRCMRFNQSAETVKLALQLLASVVTVGVDLARGLLRYINFEQKDIVQCSRRRNTADPFDVRTCFINFVSAFVFLDNNIILREIVDKKECLTLLLNECFIDKYPNVMLILQVLLKIVENKTISKTQKVRLFNRRSLKQLIYLYLWRGEGVTLKEVMQRCDTEIDAEQLQSIRLNVHRLLILLTTSRNGLVFADKLHEVDVHANDLILHGLTSAPMDGAHLDPLRIELITKSLSTCIDIIPSYLDHLAPSLFPRDSTNWFLTVDLVVQIYQSVKTQILKRIHHVITICPSQVKIANAIVNMCCPSPNMVKPINLALQYSENPNIVTKAKQFMKMLLKNLAIPLTWINTSEMIEKLQFSSEQLKTTLLPLLRERMPNTDWIKRLDKTFNIEYKDPAILANQEPVHRSVPAKEDKQEDVPEDLSAQYLSFSTEDYEEELKTLIKDVRKQLKPLVRLSNEDTNELSQKLLNSLNQLPIIAERCLETYSDVPVVYHCIVNGVRTLYTNSTVENPPKPKIFYKLLIKQPIVRTILTEQSKLSNLASDSPKNAANRENKSNGQNIDNRTLYSLKENFFSLLLELVNRKPKLCAEYFPVHWLLSSYNGTLDKVDQTILRILFLVDQKCNNLLVRTNGATNLIVWGSNISKHYQFDPNHTSGKLLPPVIFYLPSSMTLFNQLNSRQLLHSALNFPMHRKWLNQSDSFKIEDGTILDPCFLLHVFYQYLSNYSSNLTNSDSGQSTVSGRFLRDFYAMNCLSYSLAALSSYSKHIRCMGRTILALYRNLAQQWVPEKNLIKDGKIKKPGVLHFPERLQIIFLLDTLRNSLSTGGGSALGGGSRKRALFSSPFDTAARLTRIHANFFIRALQLFSNPENHMYKLIWNCLLSKPAINLNLVPDFLRLFFSTDNQFRIERHWITRLCVESLGDPADYLIMENSRVFKHLLAAYASPASDSYFQTLVLKLLATASEHSRLIHALVRFHGFPMWLWRHALSISLTSQIPLFRKILQNVRNEFQVKHSDASAVFDLLLEEFENLHSTTNPTNALTCI